MKPKKGVMPPALARYWKNKRKQRVRDPAHKKLVRNLRSHFASDEAMARRRNPHRRSQGRLMWKFEIAKGNTRLCLLRDGKNFGERAPYKLFSNSREIQTTANHLAKKFPILAGWKFYAVPTRTYV